MLQNFVKRNRLQKSESQSENLFPKFCKIEIVCISSDISPTHLIIYPKTYYDHFFYTKALKLNSFGKFGILLVPSALIFSNSQCTWKYNISLK